MSRSKRVYELVMLAGLAAAVYLYAFHFDDFSETALVRISYLWIGALAFGGHGLLAGELNAIIEAGQAETRMEARQVRARQEGRSLLSRFATLWMLSYLLITPSKGRSRPFLTALLATVLWLAVLAFFLEAIFPQL